MSRFYIHTNDTLGTNSLAQGRRQLFLVTPNQDLPASRSDNMDKMRALQFRLIRNLHARLLAVRQVTQENQKEKGP